MLFKYVLPAVLLLAWVMPARADSTGVEIHLTDRRMFMQEVDPPSDHDVVSTRLDVTVRVGTPVSFYVESGHHVIVADDGSFSSGALVTGETWSLVLRHPGNYPFHNDFHLGGPEKALRGTIHVKP